MRILITGVPGVGKTTLSEKLAQKLKLKLFSDKDLLTSDMYTKTYTDGYFVNDVDIQKFEKSLSKHKEGIFEGILFPETKIKFDIAVLLVLDEQVLRKRLKEREYNDVKIEDNVFSQNSRYLERLAKRKSSHFMIIECSDLDSDLKKTMDFIKSVDTN